MPLTGTPVLLATANIKVGEHIQGHVAGVTLFWSTIWSTVLAGVVVIGLGLMVRRTATAGVPGRLQLAYETIVGTIQDQVESSIGPNGARVVPLAFTLFIFIFICNLFELVPSGSQPEHLPAPTGDVNLTYALAIFVIVLVNIAAIRARGIRGYVGKFFRPYKVLFPINLIEEIAKPFTLALRLFGNLFAGALMLLLISSLFPAYVSWAPNIIWKLFDLFIGLIQAFIFALLTILYFESAMDTEGGH